MSRTISDSDLKSNNEIMFNLDTLTTLKRLYWDMNGFSYFRISPINYDFTSTNCH